MAEHFKLAEIYLYELSLPDSSLVIYERIPLQKRYIVARIDSLYATIYELEHPTISIETVPPVDDIVDEMIEETAEAIEFSEPIESEQVTNDLFDMLDSETLAELLAEIDFDEYDFEEIIDGDTIAIEETDDPVEVVSQTDIQIEQLQSQIEVFIADIQLYDDVYIPHAMFIQMVILTAYIEDEIRANEIYFELLETYPENRFTQSAIEFMSGEKVTFLTHDEKHQLSRFEYAMGYYSAGEEVFITELPRIVSILDSLTTSAIPDLVDRSRFTLGFIFYFDLADSLRARPFLDSLQTTSPTSEYAVFSRRFYDNGHFIRVDRLPAIVEEEIRLAEEAEAARIQHLEYLEQRRIEEEWEQREFIDDLVDDSETEDIEYRDDSYDSEDIEIEIEENIEEPEPVESG
jgi:hypothetical protein